MASIGKLGTTNEPVDLDFEWFEMTVRVHPDASDLSVADLMMEFGDLDVDDVQQGQRAMAAMSEFMVGQIHPKDRAEFWELAKANRQTIRDIMEVAKAISSAVADFRSGQQSDSSATPLPINTKSERALSLVDDGDRMERVTEAALAELKGRPDMRLFVYRLRAQEAAQRADQAAQTRNALGLAAG